LNAELPATRRAPDGLRLEQTFVDINSQHGTLYP
jgi:hypothetical protein